MRFQGSLACLLIVLGIGCSGSGPGSVDPGDIDTDPPVWTSTTGVTTVTNSDDGVVVAWGNAADVLSPPVEYLIYIDTDKLPWDVDPVIVSGNSPHTLTDLDHSVEYTIGVRCRDSADPTNADHNNVTLKIIRDPRGWSRMWGGEGDDYNWKVEVDDSGYIYVAGAFQKQADLDPSDGVDLHVSNGHWDAYVGKFDPDGNFLWAETWGGTNWDWCRSVHLDNNGRVYVVGEFTNAVYFDPGGMNDLRFSNGQWDAFLVVYDVHGNYLWANTWGGVLWEEVLDVATDSDGNIYVAGSLAGDVDLDPGPGEDIVNGYELPDAFVSKFDSDGNYIWGRHFASEGWDWATGVDVDADSNVYLTGSFTGTIDFDPGPGENYMTTNGSWDPFVVSLDSDGNFNWSKSWGGIYWDESLEISVDDAGNSWLVGFFDDVIDFDPGPEIDNHGSPGKRGAWLSEFDPYGEHQWTAAWTVGNPNYAYELDRDSDGNIFVVGFYSGTTDFDSGPGTSWSTALGGSDAYLLQYDNTGEFVWSRTWGGFSDDYGLGVAVTNDGDIYTCGAVGGPADMDPGPGELRQYPVGGFDSWLMKVSGEGGAGLW